MLSAVMGERTTSLSRVATLLLGGILPLGCGSDDAGKAHSRVQPGVDVSVSSGPIHGEAADDLRIFRGIPYAAPPLADQRFRAPTPHAAWESPLDTTRFGPGCPQNGGSVLNPVESTAEDCLTLNVWAHRASGADALRPVMVYLHGGGFVSGAGSSPLYEASRMARRGDVVVVTLNYRVGALGFLAISELREESSDNSVGNYGLLDQRAALGWIRENIEIFGGDPHNVTLFGQSAGGVAICAQLAMPDSRALFDKAIIQSAGGCSDILHLQDDPRIAGGTLALGDAFLEASGCAGTKDPLACLRRLPVQELLDAQEQVPANFWGNRTLGPSVDGVSLAGEPLEVLRAAPEVSVPVLTGSMSQEMALFVFGNVVPAETEDDYHQVALGLMPDPAQATSLESVYPLTDFDSVREAVIAMGTEVSYACPSRAFAELFAARGAKAYNYEMRATVGGLAGAVGPGHGLDVPFVFGTLDASSLLSYDDQDRALSDEMIDLWTNFARAAEPHGTPEWQTVPRGSLILEEQNIHMETDPSNGRCGKLVELGLLPDP